MSINIYGSLSGEFGYMEERNGSLYRYKDFYSAVNNNNENRVLNSSFVMGIVMKNYAFSNDTLIEGLQRQPWMTSFECGKLIEKKIPKHDNKFYSSSDVACVLKEKIKNEISNVIRGKSRVGILLSGGMDSRIIASVLRELQVEHNYNGDVVAISWGVNNSRDVIYSGRIASLYSWDFKHLLLDSDILHKNMYLCADMGAEFSPIHLHAMSDVSQIEGLDCIIAGSYGDSIGRGEYSGIRVKDINYILSRDLNNFGLIKKDLEHELLFSLEGKIKQERQRFIGLSESAYREIEMQLHYMRRQLNSCMSVIDKKIPLYQVFSDPDVYGYMWSLDPKIRNDDVYFHILKECDQRLLDIPWARTGKLYNRKNSPVLDEFSSLNNYYGRWLRNECRSFVIEKILNGTLQSLNIFDEKMLNMWCRHWSSSTSPKHDRLDEKMAWLCSLSIAIDKFSIKSNIPQYSDRNFLEQSCKYFNYKVYRAAVYSKGI